jgi:hypothetical protein
LLYFLFSRARRGATGYCPGESFPRNGYARTSDSQKKTYDMLAPGTQTRAAIVVLFHLPSRSCNHYITERLGPCARQFFAP